MGIDSGSDVCYTDAMTKGEDMLAEEVKPETVGFDSEPTMSRYSPALGDIDLYAPDAPPSEWGRLPWLLRTQHGWEGQDSSGLVHVVRPDAIMHVFHHPALIESQHEWHDA